MASTIPFQPNQHKPTTPVHVMLVEDSAVVRGLMVRALREHVEIEVVAMAADGLMAINLLTHTPAEKRPDVIILDIEMPRMDGLTALPELLKISPDVRVIMASTLTTRNADISMKAMSLGASDYVPKPSSRDHGALENFYRELKDKVIALGQDVQRRRSLGARQIPTADGMVSARTVSRPAAQGGAVQGRRTPVSTMRQYPAYSVKALAIASSTGGPQALSTLLVALKDKLGSIPVFVTQHMPPKFTTLLAEHLAKDTGMRCIEAEDKTSPAPGTIYIAPGDFHMVVQGNGQTLIHLNQDPHVNFCRPAADPMLSSLAAVYGRHLLTVVLTGMGSDGAHGAKDVTEAGGMVVVQDEESSVVWGMPGAVVEAGYASSIIPLDELGAYVSQAIAK